ncbi:MAG: hypothetical protein GX748_18355, partial [Lentisphaerae bacterium]|nr:hypothetical protein [Lentisphaerota bacterium]
MAEWIEFGETYVLGAMPSDVGAAYAAWIAAKPDKAGRLAVIVGGRLAVLTAAVCQDGGTTPGGGDPSAPAEVVARRAV